MKKDNNFIKCRKSLENIAVMLDCTEVCLQYLNYNKDTILESSEADKINNSKMKIKEIVKRISAQLE